MGNRWLLRLFCSENKVKIRFLPNFQGKNLPKITAIPNRSVMVTANTRGTRTVMVSMRFMSTQWRGSGRYYEVGYVLIAAFHRNACRFMSVFFSLFTMSANAETRYSDPWSKHSSASTRNRCRAKTNLVSDVFSSYHKFQVRSACAFFTKPH